MFRIDDGTYLGEPATYWLTVDGAIAVTTLGGAPVATPWDRPEAFMASAYATTQPWLVQRLTARLALARGTAFDQAAASALAPAARVQLRTTGHRRAGASTCWPRSWPAKRWR
jgi:hypothetical protein